MVTVPPCCICGNKGFLNALLHCSVCSSNAHQYCVGIPPGSIDDDFDWVCNYCDVRVEPVSFTRLEIVGTCRQRALKSCSEHAGDLKMQSKSEIVALLAQPEPLCMLFPIQHHGSSTQEKSSNQSQNEGSISSYMEHPDSIREGLILLVSPSGEVFIHKGMTFCEYSHVSSLARHIVNMTSHSSYIDLESKNLSTFKVKHVFSPLRKNGQYNSEEPRELHEHKFRSLREIYAHLDELANCTTITGQTNCVVEGCKENLEDDVLLRTLFLNGLKKKGKEGRLRNSCDLPEEDKAVDSKHGKRKRTVEPEVDVIQRKKASIDKVGVVVDAEGPSSKTMRFVKKRELGKQSNKCKMKNDKNQEFSSETLAPTKKMVRDQIVRMLLNAGWTVEYRRRKDSIYDDAVYVNPQGKAHHSAPKAYHALLQDINKGKVGCGSGSSSSCFRPISKKVLSVLCKGDQRSNKKNQSKARKN